MGHKARFLRPCPCCTGTVRARGILMGIPISGACGSCGIRTHMLPEIGNLEETEKKRLKIT